MPKMLNFRAKGDTFHGVSTLPPLGEAVATTFAIQEQMMPTRVVKKQIWKNNEVDSEKCRICNNALETISHITNGCTALASTLYKERHDNMLRGIYHYLLYINGITEEWHPYYELQHVKPVIENEVCTILWDVDVKTNHFTKYNKPDIVVIYKEEDRILMIEGSCPWDENLRQKICEKQNKYMQLAFQMKKTYRKNKCDIAEVVIGATGKMDKTINSAFEKISTKRDDRIKMINNCQKAAILGTLRICRQYLNGNC